MSILVAGSTGTVGSRVVAELVAAGADVHGLTRSPEKAKFPEGVTPVKGNMLDVEAMRAAVTGVRTLFLLNFGAPDELAQALLTVSLAREAGIERFVYSSVIHADRFTDVPHFASKYAVERMFRECNIPVTVLRPGYYMQNDLGFREQIVDQGIYPQQIGHLPILGVDVRDLAAVAAQCLLLRDRADQLLPSETIDVVSPETMTGPSIADIWTQLLGHRVRYDDDDLDVMEHRIANFVPGWMARDIRLMMNRFQRDGMTAAAGTDTRLQQLLGRPMRSYAEFAREMATQWVTKQDADAGGSKGQS